MTEPSNGPPANPPPPPPPAEPPPANPPPEPPVAAPPPPSDAPLPPGQPPERPDSEPAAEPPVAAPPPPSDPPSPPGQPPEPVRAREYRLHPLSTPFLFATWVRRMGILPLIAAVTSGQLFGGSEFAASIPLLTTRNLIIAAFVPFAVAAILRYLTFRYRYEPTELVIRSGLFFRRERHVPYRRIQNLDAVQNVLHRLLGVVKVEFQTGGGAELEAVLNVLPLSALDVLRQRVLEGKQEAALVEEGDVAGDSTADGSARPQPSMPQPHPPASRSRRTARSPGPPGRSLLHLPPRELILHGLLQGRTMLVIGTAAAVMRDFGLEEWLAERTTALEDWVLRALGAVGTAVVVVLFVLLVAQLISVAWNVIRLHDYRVRRSKDGLRIAFGLLTRVTAAIPLRRVQTVTVHEGPLQRLVGRVAVSVQTAGFALKVEQDPRRQRLAPILRRDRLWPFLREVMPELGGEEHIDWKPAARGASWRAAKVAALLATLAATPGYFLLGAWGAAVHVAFAGWAVLHARRYVARLGWALADDMVWFRSGWLWRRTTVARFSRVQVVAVRTTPFDRRWQMARLRVDTAGDGTGSHTLEIPFMTASTARHLHDLVADAAGQTAFRW